MRNVTARPSDILAVIVSFNGFDKIKDTVEAVIGEVGHVLVVDNGSVEGMQCLLDELEKDEDLSVTRLPENKGIAHALNVGIDFAVSRGFAWVMTMDQDSIVAKGMVERYLERINRDSTLVCLTPNIVLCGASLAFLPDSYVKYAITSGNLVKVSLFEELGTFREELFIDCVDFDFSLRVRSAGHRIYRVGNAVMHHQLGEECILPGFLAQFYTLHSPLRRYYMYRNAMYIIQNYVLTFPFFVIKFIMSHIFLLILIILYDKDPAVSLNYIWRGIRDYFVGSLGVWKESK